MTHKPPQGIDAPNCAHKQLKKQMVGEQVWYVCECGQKFRVELWDGKVTLREPGADTGTNKLSDVELMQTTDQTVWAKEFVKRFGGDEELMATWFASAMMAKHDSMVGPPNGDAMQYQIDRASALSVLAPPDPRKDLEALEELVAQWRKQAEESLLESSRIRRTVGYLTEAGTNCVVRAELWKRNAAELEQRLAEMRGAKR